MKLQEIEVKKEEKGKRIDKFVVSLLNDVTRGQIIKMIKNSVITVNNAKIKPSYRLKGNEKVQISEIKEKDDKILPNKNIILDIIENNEDFAIINKQRGLQIHPSHREREKTLVNALLAHFPEISTVGEDMERPGIVHRLDKDTTGLLVVAKNQKTFENLKKIFQERKIQKTYYTLVFGSFNKDSGIIDAPIARATSYTKQKIAFGKYKGDAKEAQTEFKVLREYTLSSEITISLVEVKPKTGRTHQIRVHMAHIGHPLVGDSRYYTKNEHKLNIEELNEYDPSTFYLHAKELDFVLNGKEYNFKVQYPNRFSALLNYLDKF